LLPLSTTSLNRNSIRSRESNSSVGVTSVDDLVADGDVASGKITRSVTSNNGASSVGIGSCGGAIAYLASSGDGGELGVGNGSRGIMSALTMVPFAIIALVTVPLSPVVITVPVTLGSVMVRSAVGSATVKPLFHCRRLLLPSNTNANVCRAPCRQ
jgi:hypothetical protein